MKKLGLERYRPVLWAALAWLAAWLTADRYARGQPTWWHEIIAFLERFAFKAFGGFPSAQSYATDVIRIFDWATTPTFAALAAWATVLVPLGFVARMMARARLRSGAADPLARVRNAIAKRPILAELVVGILPGLWGIKAFDALRDHIDGGLSLRETASRILPIALASALVHAVAAQLVASSSQEALTRVASGGADYRAATLSREALWALIEGPTVDSESRRAAAEALARTSDAGERERLRVAAEHCADPRVRVAMIELAEVEIVAGAGGVEAGRTAART